MSFRVNNDGFRIDNLGNILATSETDRAKFRAQIEAAWEKNHPVDKTAGKQAEPVPEDQTIMIVDEGDCQWTIAEDAGADPAKTAYALNKQFADPDLIHPGDVVFVDKSAVYAGTTGENGEPLESNVGIFGDQVFSDTAKVSTGPGPDYKALYDGVEGNVLRYLDSVPASQWNGVAESLILKYNWSSGDEGSYGRQLVAKAYFERLEPANRQQGLDRLNGLANQMPEGPEKTAVLADIRSAYSQVQTD